MAAKRKWPWPADNDDKKWIWLGDRLDQIENFLILQGKRIDQQIKLLTRKADKLMASAQEIKDSLAAVDANLNNMAADVVKLQELIAVLQAGQTITQEDVDALALTAKALADRTKAMADSIPD